MYLFQYFIFCVTLSKIVNRIYVNVNFILEYKLNGMHSNAYCSAKEIFIIKFCLIF